MRAHLAILGLTAVLGLCAETRSLEARQERTCDTIYEAFQAGTVMTGVDYSDWIDWQCLRWFPSGIDATHPAAIRTCDTIYASFVAGNTPSAQDQSDWAAWGCTTWFPSGLGASGKPRTCDSIYASFSAGNPPTAQDQSDWAAWGCSTWFPSGISTTTRSCDTIYADYRQGNAPTAQDMQDWLLWSCATWFKNYPVTPSTPPSPATGDVPPSPAAPQGAKHTPRPQRTPTPPPPTIPAPPPSSPPSSSPPPPLASNAVPPPSPAPVPSTPPSSPTPPPASPPAPPLSSPAPVPSSSCSNPAVSVTEIDVGTNVDTNEDDPTLTPITISPISTGSRVAFRSPTTGNVHVVTLKADGTVDPSAPTVQVPIHDFADLKADETGFVILGTRNANGGGTLNCGNPNNLCGTPPNPAIPCHDMYLIRYDGTTESWATKLTSSSADLPPYSTSRTGPQVYMIWWYAHHGRIAFDGTNWAAYFGAAISVSEGGCINIHQGDRMQVVSPSGALLSGHDSFDWGCSHSGYERIVWDDRSGHFVMICKTDNNNRIMYPDSYTTILPVDLSYSNLGDIVKDGNTNAKDGYWTITSNIRNGQPANSDGFADVHLLHFNKAQGGHDQDIVLASSSNSRAPHLASYSTSKLLAVWETSSVTGDFDFWASGRTTYIQVLDAVSGAAVSSPTAVGNGIVGNRYQVWTSFPDGSVAYASKGSSGSTIKIFKVAACA
ncbi:hypothetical protein M427DRAFT_144213 [Gonapodya prolifera JEL478]|uniref:Lytic polysaccharide monooxygenase n=1 Tax=Gonapodya prolifera (strain JEL478) TaxID=1344416 RepID=A0A139AMV3_GONPJ|nr:hypothetical protein M427DRAFT_144213 [Gonapodya prolifera JEL478]|eukprot:KXS17843.1 hypothetical protein M427DRAFT_144213 [Gonapodya prolifera JEL478]